MKREYVRPTAICEEFAANEYVATCGKTPTGKYIFKCDAPAGTIHYYDEDGNDINRNASYHPCGKTHYAEVDDFYKGYVDRGGFFNSGNGREDPGEAAVIWLQPVGGGKTNGHASVSFKPEEKDVVRS